MAPILSFTAEEVWEVLQADSTIEPVDAQSQVTIFAQCFQVLPFVEQHEALNSKWSRIRDIKSLVSRVLEVLRTDGKIGASLQAEVRIECAQADYDLLQSLGDQLKFILIVSATELVLGTQESTSIDSMKVSARASTHGKCARCWHYVEDVGTHPDHPDICGRCIQNLAEAASD